MTVLLFEYNHISYDVLFEINTNIKNRKNPYASILLTFIDINEPERIYEVEANQKQMYFDPKEFRAFFRIKYSRNLGNIFNQFFSLFLMYVPPTAPENINERQNSEIDHCLAQRGGHDPNAIYCYDARRLGKRDGRQMFRSIFISNLTERRKPELFNMFKNEPTVTFYYSSNPNDELDWIEILNNFRRREK